MWADAQRDGGPAEYRRRPLWKFPNSIPCSLRRRKLSLTPTARVPCSNAANIGERKTWTQSEFCYNFCKFLAKFRYGTRAPENVYIVYQSRRRPHRAKFGWLPLSDIAAVTKPICETRWNLLGCPKLANRSQPFVSRIRSSYCGDMWRRYWCLTILSSCQYVP